MAVLGSCTVGRSQPSTAAMFAIEEMEFSPMLMQVDVPEVQDSPSALVEKFSSSRHPYNDDSSQDSGIGIDSSPTCKQLGFCDKKKRRSAEPVSFLLDDDIQNLLSDNEEDATKWILPLEDPMETDDAFSPCNRNSYFKKRKTPRLMSPDDGSSIQDKGKNLLQMNNYGDKKHNAQKKLTLRISSHSDLSAKRKLSSRFTSCSDVHFKENIPPFCTDNVEHVQRVATASVTTTNVIAPSFQRKRNGEQQSSSLHSASPSPVPSQQAAVVSPSLIYKVLSHDCDQEEMIGDFSRRYSLPVVRGKHADLMSITPDTLAAVLLSEYSENIETFEVIDCRYPYEYEGGHIENAQNICTRDGILAKYFSPAKCNKDTSSTKTHILIFHCEFSAERAPKMMRFLRNHDRAIHTESYPKLQYPEMYLLEGGYKAFFSSHKQHCQPQSYIPMLHEDHANDLRHFKLKCKTWVSEDKRQSTLARRKTLRL